ncbi:unnamed protein product [Ilex paraguariensis]|uniref:CONSTANS-like protein n=1 Tax=Ilex paraguariensis TaxID=185542 RepID=A0ABC8R1D0_9AQUA
MGGENWSLTAKPCDSCKTLPATLFCRADTAFLCVGCDSKIHAANKLASRHGRVWMCEVCEQSPATVTCKADAASLCVTCDRDIHSANPLARRHQRFPVVPFYDSAAVVKNHHDSHGGDDDASEKYFSDVDGGTEEAEAASWLLTNPNPNKVIDVFDEMDSYLDLDLMSGDGKQQIQNHQQYSCGADRVVPVHGEDGLRRPQVEGPVVDGFPTSEVDYSGSKPFMYNFTSQSISQSVSSSSLDVGVVPDHNAMADVSNSFAVKNTTDTVPNPLCGMDREARVMRYREKRKNRKFEKTIRYASRKAYAETRPRIKGRFAKRSEMDVDSLITSDASYGIVPTY